jgi:hypothetical protein
MQQPALLQILFVKEGRGEILHAKFSAASQGKLAEPINPPSRLQKRGATVHRDGLTCHEIAQRR